MVLEVGKSEIQGSVPSKDISFITKWLTMKVQENKKGIEPNPWGQELTWPEHFLNDRYI